MPCTADRPGSQHRRGFAAVAAVAPAASRPDRVAAARRGARRIVASGWSGRQAGCLPAKTPVNRRAGARV